MGYKFLGMIVWNGGKWLLRHRFGGARRIALVVGGGAVMAAGVARAVIAAVRRRAPG